MRNGERKVGIIKPHTDYQKVFFYIHCPSYYSSGRYNVGFDHKEDRESLYREMKDILSSLGWTEDKEHPGYFCNNKCRVYPHPQSLSGYIRKEDIHLFEDALSNAKTFRLQSTARYEEYYLMSSEEYEDHLFGQAKTIFQYIKREMVSVGRKKAAPIKDILDTATHETVLPAPDGSLGREFVTSGFVKKCFMELGLKR